MPVTDVLQYGGNWYDFVWGQQMADQAVQDARLAEYEAELNFNNHVDTIGEKFLMVAGGSADYGGSYQMDAANYWWNTNWNARRNTEWVRMSRMSTDIFDFSDIFLISLYAHAY